MLRVSPRWTALLFVGMAAGAVWLAWRCRYDGTVRFLPACSGAEWIVYPNAPEILAHLVAEPGRELSTVFRRTVVIEALPAHTVMQVRALETFGIHINGQPVATPLPNAKRTWKDITEFNVRDMLVRGTNQIAITVTNRAGPPLLWLVLTVDGQRVDSDTSWEASYADAVWLRAQSAARPRPFRPGNPMHRADGLASSFRQKAATHGKLFLFAAILVVMGRHCAVKRRDLFNPSEVPKVALGGIVVLWITLFLNNLNQVSPTSGFDTQHHLGYIQYVQDHHELPRAEAGWEAHQPPLYYAFTALLLQALGLKAASPEGVLGLRVLAMLFGVGQILLVFSSLRLLFPNDLRRPLIGTAMAAFLPAHLYHAHYITNETLLALLVSGVFYLSLRTLRSEPLNWILCGALGACLGAALLTKISALVVAPVVFAALVARLTAKRELNFKIWLPGLGSFLGACLLVCGWYYWRLWFQQGELVNSPSHWAYGSGWWQEDGYRTANYYGRFGASLVHPLYSGFASFWDGLYSTLWGDGLCGGSTSVEFAPPWDYQLLALGYWLALLPTLAVIAGGVLAIWHLLRRPSVEWLLLLGVTLLFGLAAIHFSLSAPGTSQARASFGLMLLVPFCALFAWGLDRLIAWQRHLGLALLTVTVWWAATSFFAHWIPRSSAQAELFRAQLALKQGKFEEAARAAEAGLRRDPAKGMLRSLLTDSWNQLGRTNEARRLAQEALAKFPDDPLAHLDAGFDLAHAGQLDGAIVETRRALALAPDHPMAAREMVVLLARAQRLDEALLACREALRIQPHDPDLRAWLGQLGAGKAPLVERPQ